jgi:hypothetical protein
LAKRLWKAPFDTLPTKSKGPKGYRVATRGFPAWW